MGTYHTVVQGEFIAKIARAYGFADYRTLWDAPENQELKATRQNPNVLFPGDRLFIPDKEIREESRATEKKHRFELQGTRLQLRLELMGLRNQPLAGHEGTLMVENNAKDYATPSDGRIAREIPDKAAQGRLLDRGKPGAQFRVQRDFALRIGDLDPVITVSGQMARLNNLGYNAGEVPGHTLSPEEEEQVRSSLQFRSAVEEFQCDFLGQNNLARIRQVVDGICGKQTREKLLEIHGC